MSSNATPDLQDSGTTETDAPIDGPIPELDHHGRPTGARYYRCRRCGREAMRERDLQPHDCTGEVA